MTFQNSWATNFPWVQLVKSLYGIFFMMCCKFYTIIEYREKLFISKLDGLRKHNEKNMCQVAWPIIVVGKFFIDHDSQHMHNKNIHYIIGRDNIWLQVVNHNKAKRKKKTYNLIVFPSFYIRETMNYFESMHDLFQFLKVENTPYKH